MIDQTLRVVVLDSEALARAGHNDRDMTHRLAAARDNGQRVMVPAVVAAVAIAHAPSVVLTTDPDDLRLLTGAHDVHVIGL